MLVGLVSDFLTVLTTKHARGTPIASLSFLHMNTLRHESCRILCRIHLSLF